MKQNRKKIRLNKKTISRFSKTSENIRGGVRAIIKLPTTDPTANTNCFDCPPDTFEQF